MTNNFNFDQYPPSHQPNYVQGGDNFLMYKNQRMEPPFIHENIPNTP
jgi:hypothetical protein